MLLVFLGSKAVLRLKNFRLFTNQLFSGPFDQAHLGETYSSGEGTEIWCKTDEVVSADIFTPDGYRNPDCGKVSCWISGLGADGRSYAWFYDDAKICGPDQLSSVNPPNYFICS